MTALNGGALLGQGVGTVWLQPTKNLTARADVVVSRVKPLGFDFIVGMNGIKALGGALVDSQGRARFGPSEGTAGAAKEVDIRLEEPDFLVTFDHAKQSWTITWKWRNGKGPEVLKNVVREYPPTTEARGPARDPVRERWDASGEEGTVWVDASGLAIGVAVEIGGSVEEDATWLRPNDARHINMAELDAVIRGLNLVLAWGPKAVELITDSATVHRWVFDGISGKARLKTKAAGEMLIRRRIDTILSLVQKYVLHLKVTLVKSAENRADALTRVLRGWLKIREAAAPTECALGVDADVERRIAEVLHTAGHSGIWRTLYFARWSEPTVTRRQVKSVVASCEACQSIDPSPTRCKPGSLSVEKPPGASCSSRYQMGVVTGIVSEHAVEADSIPRHIRDLRRRAPSENSAEECTAEEGPESGPVMVLPARAPTVMERMWTAATPDSRTNGMRQRDDGAKTLGTLTSEEAEVRRPTRA
ncbi:hypothetical protein D918_07311 [Trichuris suis]|nr:hypothetical protein D918_07311 [Trichuris suis]